MPKKISGKKSSSGVSRKTARPTKDAKRAGKKPSAKNFSFLLKKADSLKAEAEKIAEKSSSVFQAVNTVHQQADDVHHRAKNMRRQSRRKSAPDKPETEQRAKPFLIVGVGASAGGFEAFIRILENLPADTGMAFVFVQHLDPTHESKLPELFRVRPKSR